MVRVNVAVVVPPELVAEIVTLLTRPDTGVPEIMPVAVFTDKPLGKLVALKLVGVLVAVIV